MPLSPFDTAIQTIQQRYSHPLDIAVQLGSGLMANDLLPDTVELPYQDIPGFPKPTVEGHKGVLHLGVTQTGKHVALLQGRLHFYERHPMMDVVFPVRLMRLLGAKTYIVTNAAGGINLEFQAGDLVMITDHLNMMGTNPLIGKNIMSFGPRFPDMSEAYTPELQKLALIVAQHHNILLKTGVYCGVTGPSYETPAEIKMMRTLGADMVGMSTVPEVIAAVHMGMQVLGISLISNAAAGVVKGHVLNHQEVLEAAQKASGQFTRLLSVLLETLGGSPKMKPVNIRNGAIV